MFQPSSFGSSTAWPRLEIGNGSEIPCRAPRMIACRKEIGSKAGGAYIWSRWLEARGVPRDESFGAVDPAGVPARAGAADRVEGEAADHHPGVFGVGVDRDPLAGT